MPCTACHNEAACDRLGLCHEFARQQLPSRAPGATDAERAAWLADKIVALGDYAKEAAEMLRRWPTPGVGGLPSVNVEGTKVTLLADVVMPDDVEGKTK